MRKDLWESGDCAMRGTSLLAEGRGEKLGITVRCPPVEKPLEGETEGGVLFLYRYNARPMWWALRQEAGVIPPWRFVVPIVQKGPAAVTTATPIPIAVEQPGAEKQIPNTYATPAGTFHFALRRLHSLTGLLFGGYICVHLLVNATGLWPRVYQQNVDHIHDLQPMLPLIELVGIFTPLLVHALYGFYITWAGVKFNTIHYSYGGNVRYTLQRWSAVILLAFVAFHVGTLHKWGLIGVHNMLEAVHPTPAAVASSQLDAIQKVSAWCLEWGGTFQAHNQAFQTTRQAIRDMFHNGEARLGFANTLVIGFYLLGVLSAVFHFANGLWTAAISWGLTVTVSAQRRWGHVCLGVGLGLVLFACTAWYAFTLAPWARPLTAPQQQQLNRDTATHVDENP
jgi:succinate dehydrogenase / fumarate reductase cytochrome b subunit